MSGALTILWLALFAAIILRRWRATTERDRQTYGVAWVLAAIPLCGYIASVLYLDPVPYLPTVPGSQFVVQDEAGKPMNGVAVDVEWKVLPLTIGFLPPGITPLVDQDDVKVGLFADSREWTLRAGFLQLEADEQGRAVVPGSVKPFPPLLLVADSDTYLGIRYYLHAGTAVRVYADGYLPSEFDADRMAGQYTVRLRRPPNTAQLEKALIGQAEDGVRGQADSRFVQYLSGEVVRFVDEHPTSIQADTLLIDTAGLSKKIGQEKTSLALYRRVMERNRDRFMMREAERELGVDWANAAAWRDMVELRKTTELYWEQSMIERGEDPSSVPRAPLPPEPAEYRNAVNPASFRWQHPPATYGMVQHDQVHYVGMIQLLTRFNREWDAIGWEDEEAAFERNPVILVSAGSVFEMPDRERIRGILERHVKRGGILVIFDQRYGEEFAIAPRAPGEPIAGLGWRENDLNPPNETVVAVAHPITVGLSSRTPDVQIDGYFTRYPSTSTILFRQSTTNLPAMLLYRYGKGWVVLYTSSPEWRSIENRITKDELRVVENLLNWIETQVPRLAQR